MAHSIRFTQILSRTNHIAGQIQRLHFASFQLPVAAWQPAVNVYAHADRFVVCVELAGVPKLEIDVQIHHRRLVVSGHRASPNEGCANPPCGRVLVLEIPEGAFERILEFPVDLAPDGVTARQENGLLWISLPKAHPED
jgi:HSP20 family molecular chaperone IbpA